MSGVYAVLSAQRAPPSSPGGPGWRTVTSVEIEATAELEAIFAGSTRVEQHKRVGLVEKRGGGRGEGSPVVAKGASRKAGGWVVMRAGEAVQSERGSESRRANWTGRSGCSRYGR